MESISSYISANHDSLTRILSSLHIGTCLAVLFYMQNTMKLKGRKPPIWTALPLYISPIISFVVFLLCKKSISPREYRLCPACDRVYSADIPFCKKCKIELPEHVDPITVEKIGKTAKRGFIVALCFTVIYAVLFGVMLPSNIAAVKDYIISKRVEAVTEYNVTHRLIFIDKDNNLLYFDMKGNQYKYSDEVPLYDRDGNVYTLNEIEGQSFFYSERYYVDSAGNAYNTDNCFVDEDGYFFYDYGRFERVPTEAEDYPEIIDGNNTYQLYKYSDEQGNIYYPANGASWNEKGEFLIVLPTEYDEYTPYAESW